LRHAAAYYPKPWRHACPRGWYLGPYGRCRANGARAFHHGTAVPHEIGGSKGPPFLFGPPVSSPAKAGDPVRRGLRFRHCCRWNAGSPPARATTIIGQALSLPRRVFARVVPSRRPSSVRGRRESRAPAAPAAPCAMVVKDAHGFDRYSRDIPAFPAQCFTAYFELSPVSGLYCHRCQARTGRPDRRQGRGARTTRLRRPPPTSRPVRSPDAGSGIATRTTLRDDCANAPHGGTGWSGR
jgi:hypothetical protein